MNDRELLEMAAKAAGFQVCNDRNALGLKEWGPGLWVRTNPRASYELWDPRNDDGDAFRLAMVLGLSIEVDRFAVFVSAFSTPKQNQSDELGDLLVMEPWHKNGPTKAKAARAAIIRAAVRLGADL